MPIDKDTVSKVSNLARIKIDNKIGMLANLAKIISEMHGIVGKIDLVQSEDGVLIRDISIYIHNHYFFVC